MQNIGHTFRKHERLKSKKIIEQLFKKGQIIHHYPFKALYLFSQDADLIYPAQIAVSVSKRNFKKAVDRNYIKRKLREAYRKNKNNFYHGLTNSNQKLYFFVIYTAKTDLEYLEIEKSMQLLLNKLLRKRLQNEPTNSD
jgi:ribonuclease P protein component